LFHRRDGEFPYKGVNSGFKHKAEFNIPVGKPYPVNNIDVLNVPAGKLVSIQIDDSENVPAFQPGYSIHRYL
jgi:hypothetical protein